VIATHLAAALGLNLKPLECSWLFFFRYLKHQPQLLCVFRSQLGSGVVLCQQHSSMSMQRATLFEHLKSV
jgi:hypothetical protein